MTTPEGSKMTNLSSHSLFQTSNQQQDLIRLLAQHFNSQFYRLAQSLSGGDSNESVNLSTTNHTVNQYQQNLQDRFTYSHLNPDLMGQLSALGVNANLTNCPLNSNNPNSSVDHSLQSSHADSVEQAAPDRFTSTASSVISASSAHQAVDPKLLTSDPMVATQLGSSCLDMNLFNALNCFNLTNNRFMIPLQQQYLLQIAANTRQNSLKSIVQENNQVRQYQIDQSQTHHSQQPTHITTKTKRSSQSASRQAAQRSHLDFKETQGENGRALLKFSINTILGRGSPGPPSTSRALVESVRSEEAIPRTQDRQTNLSEKSPRPYGVAEQVLNDQFRHSSSPESDPDANTELEGDSTITNTHPPLAGSLNNRPAISAAFDHYQEGGSFLSAQSSVSGLADRVANLHQANHVDQMRPIVTNSQPHHPNFSFLAGSGSFPWTVAARGKPRRGMMRRAVFSDSQRVGLEKRFQLQKYISKPDRKKLADKLGLRDSQVKIWFQNRRMKWRNSKERELLSAGGSREQTLPTRNNPNPDLSDVGETVRKVNSGTSCASAQ